MTTQTPKTAVSPSWTWGSSARLVIDTSGNPGTIVGASAQLAQVSLPEPAICSFYLQASLQVDDPLDVVESFTVNLLEGVGRVTVPRQISFSSQPSTTSPLEYTLPFVPVHALQVNVEAVINHRSELPSPRCEIETYFVLSPITRIPQKIQEMQFGMAMPGEADDLDDELSGELEAEGPTVQAMMMEDRQNVDGSSPEEEDPDGDEPRVERSPPWLLTLVDQLTRRLGRQPTRPELAKAVRRVRARVARRAAR
jgi:hypothetical protein